MKTSDIDTPRKPITKVHQFTRKALKQFIEDFPTGFKFESLHSLEKIDGQSFRILVTPSKLYYESSYSGLQENYSFFYEQSLMDSFRLAEISRKKLIDLSKFYNCSFKIVGELLYVKDKREENTTIVVTEYDTSKLKATANFFIFDIIGVSGDETFTFDKNLKDAIISDVIRETKFLRYVKFYNIEDFQVKGKVDYDYSSLPSDFNKNWRVYRDDISNKIGESLSNIRPKLGTKNSLLEGCVFDWREQKYAAWNTLWKRAKEERDLEIKKKGSN